MQGRPLEILHPSTLQSGSDNFVQPFNDLSQFLRRYPT
jgi:hypothetical protein